MRRSWLVQQSHLSVLLSCINDLSTAAPLNSGKGKVQSRLPALLTPVCNALAACSPTKCIREYHRGSIPDGLDRRHDKCKLRAEQPIRLSKIAVALFCFYEHSHPAMTRAANRLRTHSSPQSPVCHFLMSISPCMHPKQASSVATHSSHASAISLRSASVAMLISRPFCRIPPCRTLSAIVLPTSASVL